MRSNLLKSSYLDLELDRIPQSDVSVNKEQCKFFRFRDCCFNFLSAFSMSSEL